MPCPRAVAGLLLLSSIVFAQTPQAPPAPAGQNASAPTNSYLGSNVCKICHADVWANFYKNPHYKTIASKYPPERTGCESCHGPGQQHVDAGGGKTTIPRAFSLLSPQATLNACLTCHARDFEKANIRRSEHTLNDVTCTNCHSIHHSATPKYLLAKKTQHEMCYGCHASVRAQFEMPSKHRVNEGFMECSDCHNPHGAFAPTWRMSERPRMVEQALLNEEPCLKCHFDKRGPFVYEHPPVRVEGCEICHFPHGSSNSRLLRRPVVFTLCLGCHTGSGFGTRNNGVDLQSAQHNLLDPKYQKCTTCHVRLHGSNSDFYFLS